MKEESVLKNKKGNFFNRSHKNKHIGKNNSNTNNVTNNTTNNVTNNTINNTTNKTINNAINNDICIYNGNNNLKQYNKSKSTKGFKIITKIVVPIIVAIIAGIMSIIAVIFDKTNFNCASVEDSTKDKYTIENDSSDYTDNTYVSDTTAQEDSLPDDKKQDYTLYGDHTSLAANEKTSSEVDVAESEAYTLDDNLKKEKYIVTFDANGGTPITGIKEVEYGACYGELPTPIKEGYVFAGWYTDEIGGIMVTDKSIYRVERDSTLYAHWRANDSIVYTVSFDANGGSCETKNQEFEYGKVYGSLPTPTKTGSTFMGWHTAAIGGNKVSSDSIYNTDRNITLYAHWEINSYTVKFEANGGTCKVDKIGIKYGENYRTLPTPTRSGYNFEGWYTAASGGNKITSDSVYNISADSVLYAKWSNAKYIVTFNANGGSCATANKDVYYNKAYGTLPTASRTNYAFAGWYTAAVGGSKIDSDSIYGNTTGITLYAHWNSIAVSGISISNKPSNNRLGVGESVKLKATVTPSNATNQSVTWSSSNTGIATVGSDGTVTGKSAGNVTITAKCDGKTERVTLAIKNIEYGYDLEKGNIRFDGIMYSPYAEGNRVDLHIEFITKDVVKNGQIFGTTNGSASFLYIVIRDGRLHILSHDETSGLTKHFDYEIEYTLKPNTRYLLAYNPGEYWSNRSSNLWLAENGSKVFEQPWRAEITNKFRSTDGRTYVGGQGEDKACCTGYSNANVYFILMETKFVVAGSNNYQITPVSSIIVKGGIQNNALGKAILMDASAVTKLYVD